MDDIDVSRIAFDAACELAESQQAELTRLRAEVESEKATSKILLDSYADENGRISAERDALKAEVEALKAEDVRLRNACSKENDDICQTLGSALGYPKFVDDPAIFPGATEADGVCIGDHVAASLACEAADMIAKLQGEVEALRVDAEQYRWLRAQHWHDGPMCVVMNPRACVKLGSDCPSDERLDAAIDAAIKSGLK